MNEPTPDEFNVLIDQIVRPIAASARRKRAMGEELLLHLSECHRHELETARDERSASDAARQRFGDPEEIRAQLQASVPLLEQALHRSVGEKETPMSRVVWIISLAAIVVGVNVSFRFREEVHMGGVALLTFMIVRHLCQEQNLAARWLGPQWRWVVGIAGILFGSSLILPASAKIARDQVYAPAFFIALGVGVLITLSGIGFVVHAINNRRTRVA